MVGKIHIGFIRVGGGFSEKMMLNKEASALIASIRRWRA
jgi:hypothetical protein